MRALAAVLAALAALLALAPAGAGRVEPHRLCLDAADRAADRHGVPRAVMRALTRTETGRARGGRLEPWPWTVNFEGEGRWFDGPEAALAWIEAERARGGRSFDAGCFQINHVWHGDAFPSIAAMFDPARNADYAARFLSGLFGETGDWTEAAGLYHSRTPRFRDRYAGRFARILAAGDPEAAMSAEFAAAPAAAPRPAPIRVAAEPAPIGAGSVGLAGLRGASGGLVRAARGPLVGAPARRLID